MDSKKQGFIHYKEVVSLIGLERLGIFGRMISQSLLKVSKLDYLNKAYKKRAHLPAIEFIDSMFEYLGIHYEINEDDLNRIPKTGPFITVSNHPLGGIDGMILIRTLLERRQDFKVVANFLLERVEPLKPYILSVNPFEERQDARSSLQGLKTMLGHLNEGHPIGIFPAGEVSTKNEHGDILDREWLEGSIKIIRKAGVPVIPIYFHAANSRMFYEAAKLSGSLRTALLPYQMTTQNSRRIMLRIGQPIFKKEINARPTNDELRRYLMKKTYFLKNSLIENKNGQHLGPYQPSPSILDKEVLSNELKACETYGDLLFEYKAFKVFLSKKEDIPHLCQEIGLQRENTFRAIGEGTQQEIDLDTYDDYYRHLFIMDMQCLELVGAYRCGLGKDIIQSHGMSGFYLAELFDFDTSLEPMFENSIELGRAFIVPKYQRHPASLLLLWKGIIASVFKEKVGYIMGGVSISNTFSELSKSLITQFMKSYHYDYEVARHVSAKQPYHIALTEEQEEFLNSEIGGDINRLDKLIEELELQPGMRIPVLLKKYLKQNAKIIGFNIDPQFNNALDALMYLDVQKLPQETLQGTLAKFS